MGQESSTTKPCSDATTVESRSQGSQTLLRGLDVLESVAGGVSDLAGLASKLGLTRSTTYRLAAALVERRYLESVQRSGYRLGPRLLYLGAAAQRSINVVQVARPFIEALSAQTLDTVHLGVLEDDRALYMDKVPGQRRIEISSRVGERQPLTSTGLGKALILDMDIERWRELHAVETKTGSAPVPFSVWLERMQGYVAAGHAFDLEENEDRIRCVAAPIRGAAGSIVAAISVASATQYMNDARMTLLSKHVREAAAQISQALGWQSKDDSDVTIT
jgi:DNA-binding IclR family transcriptional regulator